MSGFLDFIQGKKTYIVAIVLAVFNVGCAVGWWTPDNAVWEAVNAVLVALGLGAIKSAVKKSGPPV